MHVEASENQIIRTQTRFIGINVRDEENTPEENKIPDLVALKMPSTFTYLRIIIGIFIL